MNSFQLSWLANLDSPLLNFYLQLYDIDIGINTKLAFYLVGACSEPDIFDKFSYFIGGVLGRLLPNFFADRFGPYNMFLPYWYISTVLAFAWFCISNFVGVIIFAVLYLYELY